MPLITVAAVPEFEEGTYLIEITDLQEKTIVPKQGKQAGQDVDVFEWFAALLEEDGSPVLDGESGEPLVAKTLSSKASGPSSKLSGFLVALLGPDSIKPGAQYEREDIIGKRALGSIIKDSGGYPKIDDMTAAPRKRGSRQAPVDPGTPIAAGPAAKVEETEDDLDDLPF